VNTQHSARRGRPLGGGTTLKVVNVPAYTHTRVMRLRDQLELQSMGDVVDLVTRRLPRQP